MSEPISIFNIGQHQEEMNAGFVKQSFESNLFDPKLKDINDQIAFICRPMPYYKDVVHSIAKKNYYALEDAVGTVMFDSMTTFNDPATKHYEFCPLGDLWLKLRNAQDPNVKAMTKMLRMQKAAYCYMQIVNYPANPKLNGTMVQMRIPAIMLDEFTKMAKPTEQERALGQVPVQPFDLYNGKNILVNITGKMVNNTLMRDWKVAATGDCTPVSLPLGPNGQMTPITMLQQDVIMQYFVDQQKDDLSQIYGYHEPSLDTKLRVKNWLIANFGAIPGMLPVIQGYFPELAQLANDGMAQPAPQSIPAQPAPAMPPVGTQPAAPAQPAQPAPAQPAQPVMPPFGTQPAAPATPPIGGLNPMDVALSNMQQNAAQPAAPAQPAQPAPAQPAAQPAPAQPAAPAQPVQQIRLP